jgi:hypothetical protein
MKALSRKCRKALNCRSSELAALARLRAGRPVDPATLEDIGAARGHAPVIRVQWGGTSSVSKARGLITAVHRQRFPVAAHAISDLVQVLRQGLRIIQHRRRLLEGCLAEPSLVPETAEQPAETTLQRSVRVVSGS